MDFKNLGECILLTLLSSLFALLSHSLHANHTDTSLGSDVLFLTSGSEFLEAVSCPQDPSYIAASHIPAVCKDDSADILSFTTTESGVSEFAYILTDSFNQMISILPVGGFDFNTLEAGDYKVYGVAYLGNLVVQAGSEITDLYATVCMLLSANSVTVQVMQLDLEIDVVSDYHGYPISQAGASDGEVLANVRGGTGAYSFEWNTQPPQTQAALAGLEAGTYTVQVSDEGGCQTMQSILLTEPLPLVANLESPLNFGAYQVRCFDSKDGELHASVTGGVPPYSYAWSGFSNGDSFVTHLLPGIYELTISDVNGAQQQLTYEIKAPPSIQISVEKTTPTCPGAKDGSLELDVSGGISPYSYQWQNGKTSSTLAGLKEDSYQVDVSDRFGCIQSMDIELAGPDSISISYLAESPTCAGLSDGWIALEVSGGTNPYSYQWEQGSQEASLFDLTGGSYHVRILDGNNCSTELSIELTEPASLDISTQIEPDNGTGNGSIELQIDNVSDSLEYIWAHGDSTAHAQGLRVGLYSVIIRDEAGCEITENIQVPAADKLDCLEVHTGFTPNGDGVNETWHIPCIDWFPESEVTIYNRWGQVLFQTTAYQNDWGGLVNGRPIPDGTYFYTLQLNSETDKRLLKGTVSILR
ncbi:MAG: gliding motility-associated C-terminal domain-containing protein [Bacteroidota bacterium]